MEVVSVRADVTDAQAYTSTILHGEKITIAPIGDLPRKPVYGFIKRLFDIVASILGLIVAAIPMLCVAIAVKIDSKGPAIYRQERLGKDGAPFKIYKFRSMRTDAEKNGMVWAAENDDRVTRVGRFIRKTRLDELPQMFNILCGQMSFVGPRPERQFFYEQFSTYIDGFDQRLKVKPGLTGLAQINGGYDIGPEKKIIYDVEYIKTRSCLLDLKLIFKTVAVVFTHEGAR